jgi:hypothetical protein
MADKKEEQLYLDMLKSRLSDFPLGEVNPSESPDFLIGSGRRITGIEVTRFYLSPPLGVKPSQELQALKDGIVEKAREIYIKSGGVALYVTVNFKKSVILAKRDVQRIACELVEAVRKVGGLADPTLCVSVDLRDLPESISDIDVRGSVDGEDQLWYANAGGVGCRGGCFAC